MHGSAYTGNDSGLSGVYDRDTGQRVATGGDWKLAANATSLNHRAYFYYAPNQQTAFFAKPAVEEMGNVAFTVQQLIATVGMTAAQRLELIAAQTRITSISSDSVLDRSEKRQATVDWTTLTNDNGALDGRYLALGSRADLTTVRNASVSRVTELATYLARLTPAWDNAAGPCARGGSRTAVEFWSRINPWNIAPRRCSA